MRSTIAFIFALTAAGSASAQTLGEYLKRIEFGIGHSTLHASRPLEDGEDPNGAVLSETHAGALVSFGWNWPIVKIAPDLGIGVTASARFVMSTPDEDGPQRTGNPIYDRLHPPPDGDFEPHFNIPIYVLLKYGTDAHWGWRKPFGVGLGLGYQFVYHDSDVEYWAPLAIAELSFTAQPIRGVIKLQYHHPFGRTSFPALNFTEAKTAETWSASLLYSFHFGPRMKSEEEKRR